MPADITIMMVTYNRLNLTKQTFETTMRNAGVKYNLIIIDNNSQDETIDYLEKECKLIDCIDSYKIVKLKENMGIAYGRSLCLKVCDEEYPNTKYFCTLDNDVINNQDWLKDMNDIMMNNSIICACGINYENVNYPKTTVKKADGNKVSIQIKPRGNLGTACAMFEYEVHKQLGFFDMFKCYGHEDALFGARIRFLYKNKIMIYANSGNHIGINADDSGEYREMKNKYWDINMEIFNRLIREYANGIRPLYVGFEETCLR